MRNNRELSQFASFVQVNDSNRRVGITTDSAFSGGVGIGATIDEYLNTIISNGYDNESFIVFNTANFLEDANFEGGISVGGTALLDPNGDANFNNVQITGVLTAIGTSTIIDGNITFGEKYSSVGYGTPGADEFVIYNNTEFRGISTFLGQYPVLFDRGAIFNVGAAVTILDQLRVPFPSYNGVGAGGSFAVDIDGGLTASAFVSIGGSARVFDYISVGQSSSEPSVFIGAVNFNNAVNLGDSSDDLIQIIGNVGGTINPAESVTSGIGSQASPWGFGHFNRLFAYQNAQLEKLVVIGESEFASSADFINGLNSSGITTVANLFTTLDTTLQGNLNVLGISTFKFTIDGVARTSVQANNVDLKLATDDQFYYPTFANTENAQTTTGGELFVNQGLYYNPISSDFFIGNNLSVLGNAIKADVSDTDLRFYLLNANVKYAEVLGEADELTIGGQAFTGVATIRNGQTHVNTLQVNSNNIQASTGNTNITLIDDTTTLFAGNVEFNGDTIKANSNTAYIFDQTVQYANLLGDAINVDIGAQSIGVASIRNNRTELHGDLLLKTDQILASDEQVAIQLNSNLDVTILGDLIVNGNDIRSGGGQTNITMVNDQVTIFAGDIRVNGNEILASDGAVNILMNSNTLTSITGALRVEGNTIQAGTGATNITLLDGLQTIFAGDIRVNGNSIRAANGLVNIEMEDNTKTIFQGDIQVNGDDIRAADGTICITLAAPSGNVAIGSDLTANSVFFNGNTAVLNNDELYIKDNLIDIGLLEDPDNLGTLIGPNTTTNYDAGLLLNYYSVGLDTSKKAAIFWDNSAERIAIATDVTESSPDIATVNGYAALEAKNLVINTVSGVRELFEDDGTYLKLKRVVIDAGTY